MGQEPEPEPEPLTERHEVGGGKRGARPSRERSGEMMRMQLQVPRQIYQRHTGSAICMVVVWSCTHISTSTYVVQTSCCRTPIRYYSKADSHHSNAETNEHLLKQHSNTAATHPICLDLIY